MNYLGINISTGEYSILFRVHFEHEFYVSEGTPDLVPMPTTECTQFIQRFGLLYRNTSDGFAILYKKASWKRQGLEKLLANQKLRFTFLVQNKNPFFVNFSQLPFDMGGRVYHFSNAITAESAGKVLLHPSSKVTGGELTAISSKNMVLESEEESLELELKDDFGKTHYQGELPICGGKLHADFSQLPSGKYTIYGNGNKYTDAFFSDRMRRPPFAAIEIALEEGANPVLHDGVIRPQSYYISFAARAVHWRYLLRKEQMAGMTDLSILEKKKIMNFSPPKDDVLNTSKEFIAIQTTEPVKWKNKQFLQLSFKAKKNKNGTGKQMNMNIDLPLPSYKKLNPINEELVYADVLISL